jgi:hypothetical protein
LPYGLGWASAFELSTLPQKSNRKINEALLEALARILRIIGH